MAKARDYKAEYQRRISKAIKRGLSRSQARGHARASEAPVRPKPKERDDRLEAALAILRKTSNQSRAAKEAGVSAERFRRFVRSNSLAERQGGRWRITDNRPYRVAAISRGEYVELVVDEFEQRSLNSRHLAAVGVFLRSNDIDLLRPFEGEFVIDASRQAHPLETDPTALYRLSHAGGEVFHEIYRLIE